MVKHTMIKLKDLDLLTDKQLYKQAKSTRDLLFKRKKRLEENIKNKPGVYSTHGLKKLTDKKHGIPEVSTKMNRRQLKTNLLALERLKEMKTSTSKGAKEVNKEIVQRMTFGKPVDKMTAADRRAFNANMESVKQNPEKLSDFWKAFDVYQQESMARMIDSDQLLEMYKPIFEEQTKNGYTNIDDIFDKVRKIAEEEYREEKEHREFLSKLGKSGGRFV